MVQSITSNLPAQALRQLSISPARNTEPLERLTTGPRAFTPAETEPNGASVKTSSINPLNIASGEAMGRSDSAVGVELGEAVDADLTEESALLQSLQIRQQLGSQSLSITNQAPLALFR